MFTESKKIRDYSGVEQALDYIYYTVENNMCNGNINHLDIVFKEICESEVDIEKDLDILLAFLTSVYPIHRDMMYYSGVYYKLLTILIETKYDFKSLLSGLEP